MAKIERLRVAIIGAGVGGLVLSQVLRDDPRIDLKVYERTSLQEDVSSLAGFRIMLGCDVLNSMREHLPKDTLEVLEQSIGADMPGSNNLYLMNAANERLLGISSPEYANAKSVSRWKLRRALLTGLESVIQFGKAFKSFEKTAEEVRIHFNDGSSKTCDILIGADGAGSRVRKKLLPASKRNSLGVTVIYFKMPLTPETEKLLPFGVGGMAIPSRNSFITSFFKDPKEPYGRLDLEKIDPDESFLMCGLGCYTNEFVNQSKHPDEFTPEELKEECIQRAKDWHPDYQTLISLTIPSSVFVAHIKTQAHIKPWQPGSRVTLLGDAAHSMTPYLGKGATTAIVDALDLGETLRAAASGPDQLDQFLHEYEIDMLRRGFSIAKASMRVHKLVFDWGGSQTAVKYRDTAIKLCDMAIGTRQKRIA